MSRVNPSRRKKLSLKFISFPARPKPSSKAPKMSVPSMRNDLVHCQGKSYLYVPSARSCFAKAVPRPRMLLFFVVFAVLSVAYASFYSDASLLFYSRGISSVLLK